MGFRWFVVLYILDSVHCIVSDHDELLDDWVRSWMKDVSDSDGHHTIRVVGSLHIVRYMDFH